MQKRIRIQWTKTARRCLEKLPRKVQKTAYRKVACLADSGDPRRVHKPLEGPLAGLYSIKCGRYRVLFMVKEEKLTNGDVLCTVLVRIVYAGQRKTGDRKDVYALARKLVSYAKTRIDQIEDDQDDKLE